MAQFTAGFGNIGRDDGKGSSTHVDVDSLRALRDALPDEQAVVFLCEINEGDDNNEMALVRQVFKGWHLYAGSPKNQVREPILLSPDYGPAKWNVKWVGKTGVKHWSPQRSLLQVHLREEPTSLLGMHYPAGAHGQGDRPKWAVPLLNKAWDHCHAVHVAAQKQLVARGRNVAWGMDTNDYTFAKMPIEKTVVHEHTDWMRVAAAEGFRAQFKDLPPVPFHIDSHDGQRMRGSFKGG